MPCRLLPFVSCPRAFLTPSGAQRPLLTVKGPSPSSPQPPLQIVGQTISQKSGPGESAVSSVGMGKTSRIPPPLLPRCLTPGL